MVVLTGGFKRITQSTRVLQ